MKIEFLGAAGTVTGSRYLLTTGSKRILIDAGLFQGFKNLRLKNWGEFPVDPTSIDAIFLTHAHLDHSGYLPRLIREGYRGPVYATEPTLDLCKILLPDSGYLQEEEARFANKKGFSKHNPALPLYTYQDAQDSLRHFQPVAWEKVYELPGNGSHLTFQFFPAGHLLGAASILIQAEGQSIAFSGDLGRYTDPLIRAPAFTLGADNLVVESTYGDRNHPHIDPEDQLKEIIQRTYDRNGILLIPSFAIGRAQLLLFYLFRLRQKKQIPRDLPIYLNSPMAQQANRAFIAHADELRIDLAEFGQDMAHALRVVSSAEESIALNEKTDPAIIIAASGMATGGRVLHHLKNVAPNPNNTILFVGFQAGGTRGDLMVRGATEIKIHGQYWPVKAEIINMETLSAHADATELLNWVTNLERQPKQIFITHGEPEAADAFRSKLDEKSGLQATVPEHGQSFDLV